MKDIQETATKATLLAYWQSVRKFKPSLWHIYTLMPIAQIAEEIIAPLFVARILNKLASGSFSELTPSKIAPAVLAIVFLEFFAHSLWTHIVRVFWRFEEEVMRDLSIRSFNHLTTMSYRFFSDRFSGSLVNQVNKFVSSFERLSDVMTWTVFKLIIGVIATCVILLPKAPIVVAGILTIAGIYIPTIWVYRRRQLPYNQRWAQAETVRTGQLADSVSNVVAVKSFSNEKLEKTLIRQKLDKVYARSIETMNLNMRQEYKSGGIQRSLNIFVIALSVWLASTHRIQIGIVYLSLQYTSSILQRLWDLNNTFRNISRVFGDAYDMTKILEIEPEVKDPIKPIKAKISRGNIKLESVSFGYKDSRLLFKDLNLSIKSGEKIGLVGHSGGGKTSITNLLLRFMDIQSGKIFIDGQDITSLKQADLRSYISYVSQEPILFHRTLMENIRYGRLNASDKEVLAVSKMAHAHEFIKKLPNDYETLVGERGVKLSGGQRQRVVIARAMLKNAPILLLDEATSALDSESELLIQDALWKLMESRTAIVIAHRLSTIQKMDRIIVLENGKIVEEGSHKELLHKNGTYAQLWKHQSGGFIEE